MMDPDVNLLLSLLPTGLSFLEDKHFSLFVPVFVYVYMELMICCPVLINSLSNEIASASD